MDVVPPARAHAPIAADGQVTSAAVARAAVGHDLHGVGDVGELPSQEIGEVVTPRRDDEEESRGRHYARTTV